MTETRLFKLLKLGNIEVNHRIFMPAASRMRATDDHIPTDMMLEYYTQRAAVPGTFILTEANIVSAEHSGYTNAPGIWKPEQIAAWKKISDAVHGKGSFMFLQVMAMGRMADPSEAAKEGFTIVGVSPVAFMEGATVPKVMTIEDIKRTVQQFGQAAKNAMEAGFDGIELLAGQGMLVDQFLQDHSNHRTDEYGGSIENRSRFGQEVLHAMVEAVGPERVGVRLSPWSEYLGMGMKDPIPQFSDFLRRAKSLNLAYINLIESRVKGTDDVVSSDNLDFAFDLWDGPVLVAGGHNGESARKLVDKEFPNQDVAVGFGRHFIANPDLVFRIRENLALNAYDRAQFYALKDPKGYINYPFSDKYLAANKQVEPVQ
jgi:NADPH2 dehydrogenase